MLRVVERSIWSGFLDIAGFGVNLKNFRVLLLDLKFVASLQMACPCIVGVVCCCFQLKTGKDESSIEQCINKSPQPLIMATLLLTLVI